MISKELAEKAEKYGVKVKKENPNQPDYHQQDYIEGYLQALKDVKEKQDSLTKLLNEGY